MGDSDVSRWSTSIRQFYGAGPQINYNFSSGGGGGFGRGNMPTYADAADGDRHRGEELGVSRHRSELPLAQGFRDEEPARAGRRQLRRAEGDPRRRRSTSRIITRSSSAFYTSNVEQYLFQQDDEWSRFYKNVATLPLDSTSTFIRSIGGGPRGYTSRDAADAYGGRLASVTSGFRI